MSNTIWPGPGDCPRCGAPAQEAHDFPCYKIRSGKLFRWHKFYGHLDRAWSFPILRFRGWTIRLHKFVAPDDWGYHSHPAKALRLILWGGYVEEFPCGTRMTWRPGMWGIVEPDLHHRVAELRNGRFSLSLWIRSPHTHEVKEIPIP